jgi:hypothetical protein
MSTRDPAVARLCGFLPLALLLLAAWAAVRLTPPLRPDPTPAIRAALPDRLGEWTGRDILYCQNEQCPGATTGADPSPTSKVCAACGAALDTWALGERASLPTGTRLVRRRYLHPRFAPLMAAIVLSDPAQNSIHRPRTCLAGQGYRVHRAVQTQVPLPGRPPLRLTVLELLRHERAGGDRLSESAGFYGYWFAGGGHETPRHAWVALHGAWDRVMRGVAPRWACVTVAGARSTGASDYEAALQDFVARLYPAVAASRRDGETTPEAAGVRGGQ